MKLQTSTTPTNLSLKNEKTEQESKGSFGGREVIWRMTCTLGNLILAILYRLKSVVQAGCSKLIGACAPFVRRTSLPLSEQMSDRMLALAGRIYVATDRDWLRIAQKLSDCNSKEYEFITHLSKTFEISDEAIAEIIGGAHVVLDDNGETYEKFSKGSPTRKSSHDSDKQEYAIRGNVVSELLVGVRGDKTWFQLEGSPLKLGHILLHFKDYIVYKLTGRNQSPYGSSAYTDNNPLILSCRKDLIRSSNNPLSVEEEPSTAPAESLIPATAHCNSN